jgi:hypothetical protein
VINKNKNKKIVRKKSIAQSIRGELEKNLFGLKNGMRI